MNDLSAKLQRYFDHEKNVLLEGRHGVGKSEMVKNLCRRNLDEDEWEYFSTATLDPWTDFVGVPREDDDGSLDLVEPKWQSKDRRKDVKFIFLDEYNRSRDMVRNATMELIQFKSINGRSLPNLKMVWAAINPSDDREMKYDTKPLGDAQKDRFEIHLHVPYEVSTSYFKDKFGNKAGRAAAEWWSNLPRNVKYEISPRRLDYAVETYREMGSGLSDVITEDNANLQKLRDALDSGFSGLSDLRSLPDQEIIEKLRDDPKLFQNVKNDILKGRRNREKFVPLLPAERLISLLNSGSDTREKTVKAVNQYIDKIGSEVIEPAIQSGSLAKGVEKKMKASLYGKKQGEGVYLEDFGCIFWTPKETPEYVKEDVSKEDFREWSRQMQDLYKICRDSSSNTNQRKSRVPNKKYPDLTQADKFLFRETFEAMAAFCDRSRTSTLRGFDFIEDFSEQVIRMAVESGKIHPIKHLKNNHRSFYQTLKSLDTALWIESDFTF